MRGSCSSCTRACILYYNAPCVLACRGGYFGEPHAGHAHTSQKHGHQGPSHLPQRLAKMLPKDVAFVVVSAIKLLLLTAVGVGEVCCDPVQRGESTDANKALPLTGSNCLHAYNSTQPAADA